MYTVWCVDVIPCICVHIIMCDYTCIYMTKCMTTCVSVNKMSGQLTTLGLL